MSGLARIPIQIFCNRNTVSMVKSPSVFKVFQWKWIKLLWLSLCSSLIPLHFLLRLSLLRIIPRLRLRQMTDQIVRLVSSCHQEALRLWQSTKEIRTLTFPLSDRPKPSPLLFYSVRHQAILLINGEPLGGTGLSKKLVLNLYTIWTLKTAQL